MRAAVAREVKAPLTIEDVSIDAPGERDVLVDIAACAICQSDIAYIDGEWTGRLPMVLGHEASGLVRAVGAKVDGVAVGDRVCVTLSRSCRVCPRCASGRETDCDVSTLLDERLPLHDAAGAPLTQGIWTAAFAEQVLVDHSQVARIPDSLPWASAAVISCAVLTGYGAVAHCGDLRAGAAAAVIGAGGVGVNCLQAAALAGASPLIALDTSEDRRRAALGFGATMALDPLDAETGARIAAATDGRGLDRVFICAGSIPAIESALPMLARGGVAVIVGMPPEGASVAVDPLSLASRNLSVVGAKFGRAQVKPDVAQLCALYEAGQWKLDELVTEIFPFERINEALDATRRGDGVRSVVMFDWAREEGA